LRLVKDVKNGVEIVISAKLPETILAHKVPHFAA
jgi:hypothetical protein